jgi:hypothetical protein
MENGNVSRTTNPSTILSSILALFCTAYPKTHKEKYPTYNQKMVQSHQEPRKEMIRQS